MEPARDVGIAESGVKPEAEAGNVKIDTPQMAKPKTGNETGMSATSGPMGDHMAEVWRDSDVGVKEGRPGEVEGEEEGGKF